MEYKIKELFLLCSSSGRHIRMLRSDPSKNIVLLPTGKQICLKQNYIYSMKKIVGDGVQWIAIKI